MIPVLAVVRVGSKRNRGFQLWIPLFILWVLLLPIALLVLPFFFLVCLGGRVSPVRACGAVWQTLCGLRGTRLEVNDRSHCVLVRIS